MTQPCKGCVLASYTNSPLPDITGYLQAMQTGIKPVYLPVWKASYSLDDCIIGRERGIRTPTFTVTGWYAKPLHYALEIKNGVPNVISIWLSSNPLRSPRGNRTHSDMKPRLERPFTHPIVLRTIL